MNGIYLESNCHNNSFDNVNALSNGENGIKLYSNCDDNVFYNHTINNNSESGILLSSNCDNNTFYDDFVNFNGENGIHMITCNNNSIYNNTVQNNENGIYLATSSQDNYFFNNTVKFNNYQGFCLNSSCHSNEILNNTSNNNTYIGVYLESSNTNTVKWNSLFGNYQCVSEVSCTGNVIEDNYCQDRPPGQDLPIIIENDADFNTHKSQGTGIEGDPFIIEDKIIDAKYLGNPGIFINNTDAFFIIQNCTLFNADGTLAAIYLENATHGMIENNTMIYNYDGIRAFNATNNTIFNNTINYNEQHGIFLDNSSLFTIEACIMFDNINHGVYLYESDNNTIRNNTADDNYHGIFIDGTVSHTCMNNWVVNNTLISNNQHGIYLDYSHNSSIINNTAMSNGQYGIYTIFSNYNNITLNNASFNDDYGLYTSNGNFNYLLNNTANNQNSQMGIRIHNSINITAINNTANHNDDYGLAIWGSYNVTLYENTACNNSIGMIIHTTVTSEFYNNTVNENSDAGIKIEFDANNNSVHDNFVLDNVNWGMVFDWECLDNELFNNTIRNSSIGIYLGRNNENNTFYNNTIQNNTKDGVFIENSDFNNVTDNEINYNGGHGVVLESSDNCYIMNNKLLENGLYPCVYQNGSSTANTIIPNTCNPSGPDDVTFPSTSTGSVFFNWTAVSWANRYLIFRGTAPLTGLSDNSLLLYILSSGTMIDNVTTTSYTDAITASGTYYYAVIAVNDTTGTNSTALTFGPISVTVPSGLPGEEIIGLIILFVVIGIMAGASASLYVLHKKEKIDLNNWKDKITGKSPESSESSTPKKTVEKVEPKKRAAPGKSEPVEKVKEVAKPKKAAKPTKVKKSKKAKK